MTARCSMQMLWRRISPAISTLSAALPLAVALRTFIDSVTAVDPSTVQFKLKNLPGLPGAADHRRSPHGQPDRGCCRSQIGSAAVGTGPYKLQEYKSGEYVLETKNTDWWGARRRVPTRSSGPGRPSRPVMNMALQTGDADSQPAAGGLAKQLAANPEMKVNNATVRPCSGFRQHQAEAARRCACAPGPELCDRPRWSRQGDHAGQCYAGKRRRSRRSRRGDARRCSPLYLVTVAKAASCSPMPAIRMAFDVQPSCRSPRHASANCCRPWAKAGVKLEVRRMESGVLGEGGLCRSGRQGGGNTGSVIASWSSGVNGADLQFRPAYYSARALPGSANLGFF